MTLRYEYLEVKQDTVVDYFAKEFTPKLGEEIVKKEWFFDPVKKIYIFKFLVQENDQVS